MQKFLQSILGVDFVVNKELVGSRLMEWLRLVIPAHQQVPHSQVTTFLRNYVYLNWFVKKIWLKVVTLCKRVCVYRVVIGNDIKVT